MKRSNEPVFWLLFGAGGMFAALVGAMLVFITGVAAPLGWPLEPDTLGYERMLALARHPLGKVALLAIVALLLFHGGLRMCHSLHHLGVRSHRGPRIVVFGVAVAVMLVAAVALLALGF